MAALNLSAPSTLPIISHTAVNIEILLNEIR